MRRATDAERARLHDTFVALCRIESPSGHERACAEWIAAELRSIGLTAEECRGYEGSDAPNLLARVQGRGGESILLCAHMDTVPPLAPIEPVIVDGGWENANDGILGADNKAAVAVLLELARRLVQREEPPEVGVEFLFTVSEEDGLHGAKACDVAELHSAFGYVMDHASPIGEIITASPTYQLVVAELRGRAAHAGLRPEAGRNAILAAAGAIASMRLGRLDAETTANVGTIAGGTATNVVAERCTVGAEVRGLDEQRVEQVLTEMIDHFQDAANAAECDLDVTVERMFKGYRTKGRAREVTVAEQALRSCGYEPRQVSTGGGSDANALHAYGLPCLNLANGTERNHEPGERVSIDALEGMLEVAIALVEEAAPAGFAEDPPAEDPPTEDPPVGDPPTEDPPTEDPTAP